MIPVDIILTCDIHTWDSGPHTVPLVDNDLIQARRTLKKLNLPCTFLFPSRSAELLKDQVIALRQEGHEIGCHGVTHSIGENFSTLPFVDQYRLLTEATHSITNILGGERPITFRAPAFKICGHTIQALEELGYRIDLSVVSQRISLFSADSYNFKPLFAPRRPHHPSVHNAYKIGNVKLWEFPTTALGLPFFSNTERIFGLAFMKAFFRMLYWESKIIGKPIVFLFHVEDLNSLRETGSVGRKISWKDFIPSEDGIGLRYHLFEYNWEHVSRDIVALFEYMKSFPSVRFNTATDYLQYLEK